MRSHNTSFFVFSFVLSLSLLAGSLFYGGKVKAASPLFYDGQITFYTGNRLNSVGDQAASVDFQWQEKTFDNAIFNSSGQIQDIWLTPASDNTNQTFDNAPFAIGFNMPDLIYNGGKIYIGFIIAYSNVYNNNSLSVNLDNVTAYRVRAGHVTNPAGVSGALALSFVNQGNYAGINTSFGYDFNEYTNPVFVEDFGVPGFDSFPIGVGKLKTGETSQLLHTLGLEDQAFYNFGSSGNLWYKTQLFRMIIDVPSTSSMGYNDLNIIVSLTNAITGTFSSASVPVYIEDSQGNYETVNLAMQRILYVCPVYAFACSYELYEPIESLITNLNDNVASLVSELSIIAAQPSSEQAVWLDNFARKASEAQGAAQSLSTRSAYSFTKPVGYEFESQLVAPLNDQQALPLMSLIQGFLSHTKILAILTLAVVASIIGYIFFGKRG